MIKKHFARGATGRELGLVLDRLEVADDTLGTLDELIEERRRDAARAAEL